MSVNIVGDVSKYSKRALYLASIFENRSQLEARLEITSQGQELTLRGKDLGKQCGGHGIVASSRTDSGDIPSVSITGPDEIKIHNAEARLPPILSRIPVINAPFCVGRHNQNVINYILDHYRNPEVHIRYSGM